MKILLLGDSTSFTGGYNPQTYPVHLATKEIWPAGATIENPSVAGMTSTDGVRYFYEYRKRNGLPELIIINLGNCDSCSTLYPKGRWNFFGKPKAGKRRLSGKFRGKNVMRPYTFDLHFDQTLEKPEDPDDFRFNLSKIIYKVEASKVVLIAPVANKNFIAGSGKGNFLFYRIFGLPQDLADHFISLPMALTDAFTAEANSDATEAIRLYHKLVQGAPAPFPEIEHIARNNLAVLLAEAGKTKEALKLLQTLADAPGARREIALYNQARIEMNTGNKETAFSLLERAMESDSSNYRIREPYRNILHDLKKTFPDLNYIDLAAQAFSREFIDHCHFRESAQYQLAEKLADIIAPIAKGDLRAELLTCPVTPEYAFGNDQLLSAFFYRGRTAVTGDVGEDHLRISDAARRHPLFADGAEIAERPPRLLGELGKMADAYVNRLLSPYLEYANRHGLLSLFNSSFKPEDLYSRMQTMPEKSQEVIGCEKELTLAASQEKIAAVKSNIIENLKQFLKGDVSMGHRYRTMMYWYFRESARYGAHSRPSMLYDRIAIDSAAEAVMGVAVMAHITGVDQSDWCRNAATLLSELDTTLNTAAENWLEVFFSAKPVPPNHMPSLLRPYLKKMDALV